MIRRSFDAADINPILNHPDVFRWVAPTGSEPLDASIFLSHGANILLMADDHGGFLFMPIGGGVYEVHTQFLPTAGGRAVIAGTRGAIAWMFENTDCVEIRTMVPVNNKAADWLTRSMGGMLRFERDHAWLSAAGPIAAKFYALTKERWLGRFT
jgi:hypothetical protein